MGVGNVNHKPFSAGHSQERDGCSHQASFQQQLIVFPQVAPVRPNTSLKLTRYGMQRKPGVRRLWHLRTPGLHCMPPRAA
jgi:hypothetical protein